MRRIAEKRKILISQGLLKSEKPLQPVTHEEIVHEIPESWIWTRLGEVVDYSGAKKVSPSEISEDAWLLDLEDIEKDTSRILNRKTLQEKESKSTKAEFKIGDVLYGKLRPYLNKVVVADNNGYCTTEIVPLRPYEGIIPEYVRYILKRPDFLNYVNSKTYGINLPRLGTEDGRKAVFPLPPVEEQKRIVEKCDRLLILCDDIEKRQQQRQESLLNMNESAIAQLLNAQNSDDFQHHWQHICNNFDLLYSIPETVSKLRQAILQLAVQGKLVSQDHSDNPASVLLRKIKKEKEELIAAKKIRELKSLPAIKQDETPFSLPQNWLWVRMQEIFTVITDGDHQAPPQTSEGVPFLVISNVRDGSLNFQSTRFVSEEFFLSVDENRKPNQGDILYTVVGSYGIPIVVTTDKPFFVQRHIALLKPSKLLEVNYLKYFLKSDLAFDQATRFATGIAQKTVPLSGLRKMVVPLPPLAEQKRIVAKVDSLLSLCDALEAKLKAARDSSATLIEVTARQVLVAER